MTNQFYNDFDAETRGSERRAGGDLRSPFEQDRDRIIYTSSFRRLQAKTQVFLAGEYDFYRTRLTHSIEVAQIGRSICHHLKRTSDALGDDFFVDPDLVEAVCLAHDLGHPPFGHAGEKTLNELMAEHGGFEGNAQTLRLLTDTIYSLPEGRRGMDPTRALLDGVLKYKCLRRDMKAGRGSGGRYPENHFLYDDQAPYLDFAFGSERLSRRIAEPEARNKFRSIECQIMDWADDTAYSLNDIVDSVQAGFIRIEQLRAWAAERHLNETEDVLLAELEDAITSGGIARMFSKKIGRFIQACSLARRQNFMSPATNRYAFKLVVDEDIRQIGMFYSLLARELVFHSPQIKQLEYKGDLLIRRIFEAFAGNYLGSGVPATLLPHKTHRAITREKDASTRARLICDYVAGMTDVFAVRTYKRLFEPDFGSIVDLV